MAENKEILLESGTNELEILEFNVGNSVYGINIAKVVEVTTAQPVTELPSHDENVEGVYNSRGTIIPVIDLYKITHNEHIEKESAMYIVCSFNQTTVAFHVGKVKGIQRIFWTDIIEPPRMANFSGKKNGLITGIADIDEHLIMILDFESIVAGINKEAGFDTTGLNDLKAANSISNKKIVVADDSPFLNKMIVDTLEKTGFRNIQSFKNGADAWDYIYSQKSGSGDITERIACIVSDIEMPQMDGLHLTKRVKDDDILKNIPVYLFSSLINEQMEAKCRSVGADGQFSKPQITVLIKEILKHLGLEE